METAGVAPPSVRRMCPALLFRVDDISPVQVAPAQTLNKNLGRGHIGGEGYVVLITEAGYLIGAGRVNVAGRITEEKDEIDLVIGDPGADLLVAALTAG